MKILAIETSCDDTGIAILEVKENKHGKNPEFLILANKIASQIKVHQKYGGVYPMMAKREHQRNLLPTFVKALREARLLKIFNSQFSISNKLSNEKISKLKEILNREPELAKKLRPFLKKYKKPEVDYIAVTNGPGLEPCLWVGVNFARALSYFWDIPIIPANHIEGHILVNFLPKQTSGNNYAYAQTLQQVFNIELPAVALVVSGGHTQLILINKIGDYKILGETRDDAAGECFDKSAKILGLGYPGGPIISKLAKNLVSPELTRLPRPMMHTKDYDFSFSGLKTAILYSHQKQPKKIQKNKDYIAGMCAEIQQAIIDVLLKKTLKAVKDFNARTIILGGGVSANSEIRKQFAKAISSHTSERIDLVFPPSNLSTDNGVMIAVAGYFNIKKGGGRDCANWQTLKADSNLRISE